MLRPRDSGEFRKEDIGYLTRPIRLEEWILTVRDRYAFLAELGTDERSWACCNERDLYAVNAALEAPSR